MGPGDRKYLIRPLTSERLAQLTGITRRESAETRDLLVAAGLESALALGLLTDPPARRRAKVAVGLSQGYRYSPAAKRAFDRAVRARVATLRRRLVAAPRPTVRSSGR